MPDRIHLTVATIVHHQGLFLMVREMDNNQEVINQPAGHVEPGETLQQAALRETLEETGWHVRLTGVLGLSHFTSPTNGITYYRVSFSAVPLHQEDGAQLDGEILSADWMTAEQVESSTQLRSPVVLSDLRKYTNNILYPLDIITNLNDTTHE